MGVSPCHSAHREGAAGRRGGRGRGTPRRAGSAAGARRGPAATAGLIAADPRRRRWSSSASSARRAPPRRKHVLPRLPPGEGEAARRADGPLRGRRRRVRAVRLRPARRAAPGRAHGRIHFAAYRLKYSRWVWVVVVPDERVESLVRALLAASSTRAAFRCASSSTTRRPWCSAATRAARLESDARAGRDRLRLHHRALHAAQPRAEGRGRESGRLGEARLLPCAPIRRSGARSAAPARGVARRGQRGAALPGHRRSPPCASPPSRSG